MSLTVCLCANTLYYPEGGGHLWVYLNWALGLRGLGHEVIWLEELATSTPPGEARDLVEDLRCRLEPYGLAGRIALSPWTSQVLSADATEGCLELEAAAEADLLLNFQHDVPLDVVKRFARSAFVDIDPGLLQIWTSRGLMTFAPHDKYFTIGETVGQPGAPFPDLGLCWLYTPPCVALDWWPVCSVAPDAPFTTVVHWFASSWMEDGAAPDDKRSGFQPYLDLPRRTAQRLELAINLGADDDPRVIAEREVLTARGWQLRHAHAVASTPWDYQRYIQDSWGEFSCAKPSCLRLQNAWISDRTLCYLASGKPAVVEHTGPSRFLPDAAGLFRFRTLEEAARSLEMVAADYEHQSRLARSLAEEYFDARKVVTRVLERALA